MKILFVHPYNIEYPGGAEKWIVEVSKRLKVKGHKIAIAFASWPCNSQSTITNNFTILARNRITLYKCSYIKLPRGYPIIDPKCILQIVSDYDIIYVYASPPNELFLYLSKTINKRLYEKPIIAVFHSMLEPHRSLLHKLYIPLFVAIYNKFDKLHVLNGYMYKLFTKYYNMPDKKVVFIPNGVDTSIFRFEKHLVNRSPSKYFEILFVSRFIRNKGVITFHKVVETLNEKYPSISKDILFKIAGVGPLKCYIDDLVTRYNNVIYLGFLEKRNLAEEYLRSHMLILTSFIENMPLTLLEASACGLPAVASAIPGVIDVIETVNYGILVKPGNIEGFVRGIVQLYNAWKSSPEHYFNIRKRISERTAVNYDWNIIINRIERMFLEALNMR